MADRYWVGGAGTWNTTTTTNWSATSGGAGGASAPTAADSVFFNQAGTYTVTLVTGAVCLDITVSAGTVTFGGVGATLAVSGSMSLRTGTVWSATGAVTFNATTSGKTITTNGTSFTGSVTFNGAGGVWTLGSALTTGATLTVTAGTLDTSASNYAITCVVLNTTSTAGAILTLNASTVTVSGTSSNFGASSVLNAGTSQINFTSTGTMNFTGGGKTFYNVTFSAGAAAFICTINSANTFNNLAFSTPSGSGTKSVVFAASQVVNGTFTGSGSSEIQRLFYRSSVLGTTITLTLANPATISNCDFRDITAATNAITATGGGNCGGNTNITGFPTAKTVYWNLAGAQNWSATGWATTPTGTPALANFPLAQDTAVFTQSGSVTGTISIEFAWNIGTVDMSGRTTAMTLATGTTTPNIYGSWLNGTGTTLTGTGTLTFSGRGNTQQINGNGVPFTQFLTVQNFGGTVQLTSGVTLGPTLFFSFNSGTLDLQSYTLTTGGFTSSISNARTLAFGTGNITVNGTGNSWNTATTTGLTVTGTPVVNVSNNTATSTTISAGTFTEANSISFNFTTGTYALAFLAGSSRNLNFTGFAGTVSNASQTIYGDLNLGSTATFTAGTNAWTFASTSATPRTITSNGKTMNFPLTFDGVDGSWVLQDALTMGSTRTLTHTNGTLNLNGKTLTVGTAYTTAAGTKNLTFNGGTLVCPTAATTAFNNAAPTNYTTTAGTGTGTISMTAATAKTFVGGGSTFNCTLNQGGLGALTLTGANTFTNITNTVQPASVLFTAGTTTTFSNFNLNGTAGNLITISSVTAATHTLSKASGTVSCNYLSITNSIATGGASWYAGANSTNVSGNTGWIFTAVPGNINVNVTGVEAIGSVGIGTVVASARAPPTGVEATGSVGTVVASISTQFSVTGVEASGAVGTVLISGVAQTTLTGVEATGSVGTVAASGATQTTLADVEATGSVGTVLTSGVAKITLTGVQAVAGVDGVGIATGGSISVDPNDVTATGSVGTPSFALSVAFPITGVQASGAVGTAVISLPTQFSVTGVQASGAVGTAVVSLPTQFSVTGVEATGTAGTASVSLPRQVLVTGVEATGAIGTANATGLANVLPTSVQASGEVGTPSFSLSGAFPVTGVGAIGSVGTVAISIPKQVSVTGLSAANDVGTVAVEAKGQVFLTGVAATGAIENTQQKSAANVTLTGVVAQGAVGTVTTRSAYYLTGVSAVCAVGTANVVAGCKVFVAGVQAAAVVTTPLVWGVINDSQTPNWGPVDDLQAGNWAQVNDNQTPNWTPVNDAQTDSWTQVNDGNTVVWTQIPT